MGRGKSKRPRVTSTTGFVHRWDDVVCGIQKAPYTVFYSDGSKDLCYSETEAWARCKQWWAVTTGSVQDLDMHVEETPSHSRYGWLTRAGAPLNGIPVWRTRQ